jgi:hypothetical protein
VKQGNDRGCFQPERFTLRQLLGGAGKYTAHQNNTTQVVGGDHRLVEHDFACQQTPLFAIQASHFVNARSNVKVSSRSFCAIQQV